MRIFSRVLVFCFCVYLNLNALTLDFVETPLNEVARALSIAYETPILVEKGIDEKLTIHLDSVGVLEGLSAICESLDLELVQKEKNFIIKKKKDLVSNFIEKKDSLITISVVNKNIQEFVKEFSAYTGLNVLCSPEIEGKISGFLQNLKPEIALKNLVENHDFYLKKIQGGYRIEQRVKEVKERPLIERQDDFYSVNFNGESLAEILKQIAENAELNLALYGNIDEKVYLKFSNVSLEYLLSSIFKGSKYVYALDSLGIYVSALGAKNPLSMSKIYSLKYVHAEKALAQLNKLLPSDNFVASEIKEQNAILLAGSIPEIEKAKDLLFKIDVPLMQVTLSCMIVEIKKGSLFELGLHSGASRKTPEKDVGIRGFTEFFGKDKTGAFGKIGVLPERFEFELASLEENNFIEVLARPSLTTLNGNKAELNVTNTVYYLVSQVSADGYPITDYRSFNDGISLELTPSVTQEGSITLEVSPEIKTAGRSTGDGPRDISTRNLKTTVLLKNGETLCLGGLRRKNKTEVRSAIPFLGRIPFIGKFFSYTSEEEEDSELAIFITPEVKK